MASSPTKDNLSKKHYDAVRAEIMGRFFSQEEADRLKGLINFHTLTDHELRTEAAKTWAQLPPTPAVTEADPQ